MKEYLQHLAAYNVWANQKFWDIILELSAEQLKKEIPSSFPSIVKTVKHMYDAENVWWRRLKNTEFTSKFGEDFPGNMSQLVDEFTLCSAQWLDFVKSCTELDLSKSFQYKRQDVEYQSKVQEMLIHLFNHGTYHRGQLVTMLRQLGITKIPATDFIAYSRLYM